MSNHWQYKGKTRPNNKSKYLVKTLYIWRVEFLIGHACRQRDLPCLFKMYLYFLWKKCKISKDWYQKLFKNSSVWEKLHWILDSSHTMPYVKFIKNSMLCLRKVSFLVIHKIWSSVLSAYRYLTSTEFWYGVHMMDI